MAAREAARGGGRARGARGLARFAGRADGRAQGLFARHRFAGISCYVVSQSASKYPDRETEYAAAYAAAAA